jgi:uncharacterized membrane protein
MSKISQAVLFTTAITTGLVAGLFYSWTVAVTPGLKNLSAKEYILAFQAMNKAILNPAFFLTFMGTLILLPLVTWMNYSGPNPKFYLLLAACLCYGVGVFGITVFGNVPLNESLATVETSGASMATLNEKRLAFEARWNSLNTVRTISSIAAFALVIVACMRGGSGK